MENQGNLARTPYGLVSTSKHGLRALALYAMGWRTVAALCRPWRRRGSGGCSPTPLQHWLVVDVVAFVMSSASSGRSRDVTIQGG